MNPSNGPKPTDAQRRRLLAAGVVTMFGGLPMVLANCSDDLQRAKRADGKPKLPPGQVPVQPVKSNGSEASEAAPDNAPPVSDAELAGEEEMILEEEVAEVESGPLMHDGRRSGRAKLPPGQFTLKTLRDMGGSPGIGSRAMFRLKVHGEVKQPLDLSFSDLFQFREIDQICDVHCVTKWSVLDARWLGVRIQDIADKAGVRSSARHVIFEAANGFTANVRLEQALADNALVAYKYAGDALALPHGAPVRSLVPDLYFWKSAKWLTGIKFTEEDEPGYWERGIYHNNADPWKEERFNR